MGATRSRRLVGALLAAAALGVTAAPAASAADGALAPCGGDAGPRTQCGRVTVPLDRSGALAGTLSLRVRALAPRGGAGGAGRGTIVAIAGGPGQAAVPLLEGFATVLRDVLRTRRLVTFDQRGTGGSGRLACPALSSRGSLADVIGRCAAQLGPRRAAYTTAASVADVEAVRAALGVERITLYAASYGTRVALLYAAAHPDRVERLVLDSAVPPEGVDPFQLATLAAVPRVLRDLCSGDCGFTDDAAADLQRLARRLARRPLRGLVVDAAGRPRPAAIGEAGLLGLLLVGDFDRFTRAATPAAVRAALDGDPAPLLRLTAHGGSGAIADRGDSDAVYAATSCEDGRVPWPPATPPAERGPLVDAAAAAIPDAAFAPFDRATARRFGTADLCRAWPESPIVQELPSLPATPTLILSGDGDLRTPREDAAALAARLPGAQLVRVPDTGHGVLFSEPAACGERAVAAFLEGSRAGACPRRPRVAPPTALPPRRLAALRPAPGMHGRAGRTVTAVGRTLEDAVEQVLSQITRGGPPRPFGGLRGGRVGPEGRGGLRLQAYSYVPGVTVSGLFAPSSRRVTVAVGGRVAARGTLTLSGTGISGTLGGERIDLSGTASASPDADAVAARSDPRRSAALLGAAAAAAQVSLAPPPFAAVWLLDPSRR